MSFFSNNNNIHPGRMDGSPTHGLRHRAAICVERVLDSGMKQEKCEGIVLCHQFPADATFITANSTHRPAEVSDLTITRIQDRPTFARVRCNVTIPMEVEYKCKEGKTHTAKSELCVKQDMILFVPQASVFPFEVKAVAGVNCPSGVISDDGATVTACITTIIKIVAQTDLLIPTYGFMPIPQAIEFEKSECKDYFDLPLFPSGRQTR